MKTKITIFVFILLMSVGYASAQITEGVPSSKKIRVGNRPDKGTFGLYMGVTSNMFGDMFNDKINYMALPLINLKYMVTDKLEARVGVEFYEKSARLKGSGKDSSTFARDGLTHGMFYPGVAYHFSKSNIFDVYVGGEIPLGWNSTFQRADYSTDSYVNESKVTKNVFKIGMGVFIGVQVFVANLPLAIGVEYGLSSMFETGVKFKHEVNNNGNKQTYYTSALDGNDNTRYEKLSVKQGTIGNQARITISYYFK